MAARPPDWDLEGRRIHRRSIVLGACLGAMMLLACVLHDHLAWVHCGSPEEPGSMEDDIASHVPWVPPPILHAFQQQPPRPMPLVGTGGGGAPDGAGTIDPTQPCPGSWVTGQAIDAAGAARLEAAAAVWRRNLTAELRAMYNAASGMHSHADPTTEPAAWARFDAFLAPPPAAVCPSLRRVGGDGDGGKWVCGLEYIPDRDDDDGSCIVYSVGGNNEWSFEAGIVAATRYCVVHTFDCTVAEPRLPPELKGRVVFHPICLGPWPWPGPGIGPSNNSERTFMHLGEAMTMLGHARIHLLKMDIEGFEYDVLDELADETTTMSVQGLPEQINVELHWSTPMAGLDWHRRQLTAGELAVLALRLDDRAYRLVSREDNPLCEHCAEFTLVRLRCGA